MKNGSSKHEKQKLDLDLLVLFLTIIRNDGGHKIHKPPLTSFIFS